MNYGSLLIATLFVCSNHCTSEYQLGPDPWNSPSEEIKLKEFGIDIPPDLRASVKKERPADSKHGFGEWWFRRILTIILKNGQVKENDDGSMDVSLQMRFDKEQWSELDEYLKSATAVTDAMFRRSVGYIEEAIYKPTITDQIIMAWSDYVQVYLVEYKTLITWSLGILAGVGAITWLWQHISHKHVIVILGIFLYVYEVIISYKEAEQQELEKFLSAVNTCKWHFWTSECTVPSPDPLVFMKHMNPLKIAIRMFTSLISEPMITLNATIKITIHSITDGLWFPFDKIVYLILIVIINVSLIYLLVMIVFNFIFNIPFNLNLLGILSVGVKQKRRDLFSENNSTSAPQTTDTDRISGESLTQLLNVFSVALNNAQNTSSMNMKLTNSANVPTLRRSASTGRLPNERSLQEPNSNNHLTSNSIVRRMKSSNIGGGDH